MPKAKEKKPKLHKIAKIHDPVLGTHTWAMWGCTPQECSDAFDAEVGSSLALFGDMDTDNIQGITGWISNKEGQEVAAIYVVEKDDFAVLTHECVHAAVEALDQRGIDIRNDRGEILAYYVEFLFTSLRRELGNGSIR